MGEANEGSSRGRMEIDNLGVEISDQYPRDLLQTFIARNPNQIARVKQEIHDDDVVDDGDVQLNLGLSLGGRFGVDKSHGGLMRSSSVVGALSFIKQDGYQFGPPRPMVAVAAATTLPRTASLPVETEEERRKRKELQTFRRMEAKKRRSEKRSNILKEDGEGRGNEASLGEKLERVQQCESAVNKLSVSASLPTWTVAGCSTAKKSEVGDGLKVKRSFFSSLEGLLAQEGSSSGSGRSQGGSSSAVPEPDRRRTQGSSTDTRVPMRTTSDIRCRSYRMKIEDNVKQAGTGETNKIRETTTGLEDMPCVFTIGDGPNGRKVDGILYKYGKGEEIRIMCLWLVDSCVLKLSQVRGFQSGDSNLWGM
ncbi:Ninja-family protein AFP1-like protein [Drosera capensis]